MIAWGSLVGIMFYLVKTWMTVITFFGLTSKCYMTKTFPVKKTKFNKNLHKICNYMTQGLLVSRQSKIKLHKISIQSPNSSNIERHKKIWNLYNTVMRASKKMYFEKNLNLAKKNPKKSWQLIKEAIGDQKQSKNIKIIFCMLK